MDRNKWGLPDSTVSITPGVLSVTTPSHGGFILSQERNRAVPYDLRNADGCYEEDCEWAIAWLCLRRAGIVNDQVRFRNQSAQEIDAIARTTVLEWYPDQAKRLTGIDPDPKNRILQERRDYADAREKGWLLAVAAVGDSVSNAVPEGMVGAVLAPAHAQRDEPDRDRQFFALVPAALYADSRLESGLRIFDETEFARISFDPFHAFAEPVIAPEEAYDIASRWGSYIRDGDPGAVFYTFPVGDARPQNPQHRLALIAYTHKCQMIAQERITSFDAASSSQQENWPWDDPREDLESLKKLAVFFAVTEQAPEPEMEPLAP